MSCHVTIVESSKPGLILLTEVISKAQTLPIGLLRISIPVYHLFTNFDPGFCDLGKSGSRGIVVYVANYLQCMQTSFQSTFSEQLRVKVSLSENHQLLVGSIYRSSSLDKVLVQMS